MTVTERRPSVTERRMTVTEGRPSVTEGRLTVTEGRPTVKGGSLSRVGRRALMASGAATGFAVAVLACRQLVGIGDEPPQGQGATPADSGAEGGFTYGQGDCATCVTTSCGPQAMACAETPSCAALEGCMSAASGDPTKRAQCGVDHGLGNDVATPAFEACLAGACETACGLTCGGLAAVFPPATAPACEGCIKKQECTSVSACAADPTCQAAVRCQFTSGITLDVQQACPAVVHDAGPVAAALMGANPPIAGSCPTECSWGADWSCLGKVSWPKPTTDAVSVIVYAYGPSGPVDQATVKLCFTSYPSCVPPVAGPVTSDAGGTVTVQRPATPLPPLFFVDLSSPAITPALTFDVFPVSQPQLTIPFVTVPQGILPSLALQAGVTQQPGLGMLLVHAADCRLAPAPGVTFDLEPPGMSKPAYLVGSLPVIGATATDSSGTAVFANVDVDMTLQLTVKTPHGPSGTMSVFTRDGGLSELYAVPTQMP